MRDVQQYTGCNHLIGDGFHMSLANPLVKLIDGNSAWYLEWHHYFGPIACKRNGDPLSKCPSEKSRFWIIAQLWKDQGCRVVDGVGLWDWPVIVKTGDRIKVGRYLYQIDQVDSGIGEVVELWEYPGYERLLPCEIRKKDAT